MSLFEEKKELRLHSYKIFLYKVSEYSFLSLRFSFFLTNIHRTYKTNEILNEQNMQKVVRGNAKLYRESSKKSFNRFAFNVPESNM